MKEADYKRKLVAEVNALRGGYARRIEDRFAVGMLDLIIKLPDVPLVFAEAKLINGNFLVQANDNSSKGAECWPLD